MACKRQSYTPEASGTRRNRRSQARRTYIAHRVLARFASECLVFKCAFDLASAALKRSHSEAKRIMAAISRAAVLSFRPRCWRDIGLVPVITPELVQFGDVHMTIHANDVNGARQRSARRHFSW